LKNGNKLDPEKSLFPESEKAAIAKKAERQGERSPKLVMETGGNGTYMGRGKINKVRDFKWAHRQVQKAPRWGKKQKTWALRGSQRAQEKGGTPDWVV